MLTRPSWIRDETARCFDLSRLHESLCARPHPLVTLNRPINLGDFRPALRCPLEPAGQRGNAIHKSQAVRKPMDEILMFQVLILPAL